VFHSLTTEAEKLRSPKQFYLFIQFVITNILEQMNKTQKYTMTELGRVQIASPLQHTTSIKSGEVHKRRSPILALFDPLLVHFWSTPCPQSGCPHCSDKVNIWKASATTATYSIQVSSNVIKYSTILYCILYAERIMREATLENDEVGIRIGGIGLSITSDMLMLQH